MTFTIEHSNGRRDAGYESLADAIAQLRRDYDHVALKIDSVDADVTIARDVTDTADYAYLACVIEVL